jgi:hypothetical protein
VRGIRALVAAATCGAIATASSGSVAAATPDSFRIRSAQDLVALCSADPAEANYVAAIHFCHGFAVGAFQYYENLAAASPSYRFVCVPKPPPSRSQAIASFVAWAQGNPQYMTEPAIDAVFRHLGQTYPCTRP